METLNFMALSSLKRNNKDMEETLNYWKAAIQGAIELKSEQRFSEALLAYHIMEAIWSSEKRISELRDLVTHW